MPKKLKIVNQEKVFFLTVGTLSVYNEFTDTGNSAVKLFFLYYLHGTKKLKKQKNKQTILWLAVASYDFSESKERGNKARRCTSQSKSQSHCLKAENELGSTNNPLPHNTFKLFFVIKVTQDGQILYNSQKSHQPQSSFYALYPAPLKELQFDGAGHSLPLLSLYL